MTAGLKLLTVSVLLLISACVSAGAKAITDAGVVSRIEVGKSTRADVAALLGYPITASYGGQGEETWHYTRVTTGPSSKLCLLFPQSSNNWRAAPGLPPRS
ncbi:MAG: outer membrane protein assembly factor BamE [Deltaproteobacteria bacterium]|nr:outer membrane protein assembly factor BamE [Deltaproteobacteria bacterium]